MKHENILVDKLLTGIWIASDSKALKFDVLDSESIIVRADGDCCSDTWVEQVELPALGFPARVSSVVDLDMPDLGSMDGRGVVAYYGLKISTDRGDIIIDYRNDSNGYYGGNLCFPDDYFYGGVYGQNTSTFEWKKLEIE